MPPKRKNDTPVLPTTTPFPEHNSPRGQQGPQSKRQRVSQACDQCRTAREKCDGIQPHCYPCVSQNRQCTFQAKTKKRGVQTGYIRTLELALAWVFENVPKSEDALVALLTHEGGEGQRLLAGKESDAANRLHRRWRKSRAHRGIEHILSGVESPLPQVESPASETAGDSEDGLAQMPRPPLGSRGIKEHSLSLPQGTPTVHTREHVGTDPATTVLSMTRPLISPVASRGLRLPPNHWQLLDIYFSYTHCWLPVLNKQELFQASYQYATDHDSETSLSDPSTGVHAELWSALALASIQDAAVAVSSLEGETATANQAYMSPDEIYDTAKSMIPQADDGLFHLHHVRALLLLSLVHLGRDRSGPASLTIGRAVRILLANRANKDEQHSDQQSQRSDAAFITCFILETIISLRYGIPSHLTADDMVGIRPIPENDLDEWQPWTACEGFAKENSLSRALRSPAYCLSTFNQLFEILRIVGVDAAKRRGGDMRAYGASEEHRQLQQSIKLNGPFGPNIISEESAIATVPPPYVLKVVYLWAEMSMGCPLEPRVRLLSSVIKEYQTNFGTCAVAPLMGLCLAFVESHHAFTHLHVETKQEVTALRASYRSIWNTTGLTSSTPKQPDGPLTVCGPAGHPAPSLLGISPSFPVLTAQERQGTTPRSSSANPATTVMPPAMVHSDQSGPYAVAFEQQPQQAFNLFNSSTMQGQGQQGTMRDVPHVRSTGEGPSHAVQTPQFTSSYPNWSATSLDPLDYDTLLDDLASIDCADGVGTDPQFMTNLGFAPGCDLAEIYSQSFAQYQ